MLEIFSICDTGNHYNERSLFPVHFVGCSSENVSPTLWAVPVRMFHPLWVVPVKKLYPFRELFSEKVYPLCGLFQWECLTSKLSALTVTFFSCPDGTRISVKLASILGHVCGPGRSVCPFTCGQKCYVTSL